VADIGVVVGKLLRLRRDSLGDLLPAIADVDAVETGKGIKQLVAVAVFDVDALAPSNDARGAFAASMLCKMGRGMEEVFAIPLVENVVGQHGNPPAVSSHALWRQTYLRSV